MHHAYIIYFRSVTNYLFYFIYLFFFLVYCDNLENSEVYRDNLGNLKVDLKSKYDHFRTIVIVRYTNNRKRPIASSN
jgi:hypothetical protein